MEQELLAALRPVKDGEDLACCRGRGIRTDDVEGAGCGNQSVSFAVRKEDEGTIKGAAAASSPPAPKLNAQRVDSESRSEEYHLVANHFEHLLWAAEAAAEQEKRTTCSSSTTTTTPADLAPKLWLRELSHDAPATLLHDLTTASPRLLSALRTRDTEAAYATERHIVGAVLQWQSSRAKVWADLVRLLYFLWPGSEGGAGEKEGASMEEAMEWVRRSVPEEACQSTTNLIKL
ncbi:hypothetical protein EJ03DRAFT_339823 [Teratosphaeria nubilosa]|uniref:Uncharacterized protein n=1 Tax=Teratosphaeria nubilosa TaxID=161662 RepID=A0A6G1KVF0_9PEZI|nr:hypothetical protein EJ03DRAFT_339823 [Teratosphaeria nubilosa]